MKTQYTQWREAVALLTPEERSLLACACVAESAAATKGTPAEYAWNRAFHAIGEADALTPSNPEITVEPIPPRG